MSHALRLGSNDVPLLEINIEHMTVKLDVTCHVVEYSGLSFHKLDWTRLIVQPQNMDLKMLQENTSHEVPLQPFPFSVVIFWCIFFQFNLHRSFLSCFASNWKILCTRCFILPRCTSVPASNLNKFMTYPKTLGYYSPLFNSITTIALHTL